MWLYNAKINTVISSFTPITSSDANDSVNYSRSSSDRCIPGLALQYWVGLLSSWRPGLDFSDPADLDFTRSNLAPQLGKRRLRPQVGGLTRDRIRLAYGFVQQLRTVRRLRRACLPVARLRFRRLRCVCLFFPRFDHCGSNRSNYFRFRCPRFGSTLGARLFDSLFFSHWLRWHCVRFGLLGTGFTPCSCRFDPRRVC